MQKVGMPFYAVAIYPGMSVLCCKLQCVPDEDSLIPEASTSSLLLSLSALHV